MNRFEGGSAPKHVALVGSVALLDDAEVAAQVSSLVTAVDAKSGLVIGHERPRALAAGLEWDFVRPSESGHVPRADRSVDVVVLDDPRGLTPPAEQVALVREAWRVARGACVIVLQHPLNKIDSSFETAVRETWGSPITAQRFEHGTILIGRDDTEAPGMQETLAALARRLEVTQTLAARLRADLNQAERERDDATRRLARFAGREGDGEPSTLAKALREPGRKLKAGARRLRDEMRVRGFSWPESYVDDEAHDVPPSEASLPFAGIAARARPSSPEAFLAATPKVVAICHPHWRGIRAATMEQTEHVIEVLGFSSRSHARRFAGFLQDARVENVVINGYPPGMHLLVDAIAEIAPHIRVSIVYHGTPALSYGEDVVLESMLELFQRGRLFKLGFVKHGLAEYFRMRGARAEWVMNRLSMEPQAPSAITGGRLKIGVFAPSASHKNVETQLVAALLVPGAEVHTIEPVRAAYLMAESPRIISHGLKPRPEFLALLASMQAATYVSLVECYPMTVLESIFSGVICVTSNTSVLFDDSAELRKALVVPHHDSPAAIAAKIADAVADRERLIPLAQAHLQMLNGRAEVRWHEFIEA